MKVTIEEKLEKFLYHTKGPIPMHNAMCELSGLADMAVAELKRLRKIVQAVKWAVEDENGQVIDNKRDDVIDISENRLLK